MIAVTEVQSVNTVHTRPSVFLRKSLQKLLMFVHLREEKMTFVESNGLYEALKSKTSFIVDFYTTDQDIKLQSKIIKLKVRRADI